ncbi:hypothetical protein HETIRDRAFT_48430 [Heterobasidion irregulare TC 32-1]|uniref:Uncharacterized protein n=1 Tax=Heterobasidion irregulare (strain TC 32-1) TaxID=747525 RepID=W4KH41_HETIT|nr:uncharacterized protein HETIRDRAFT_48430 [Heterobasidion irregulare TC 32-1]ETW84645.1 hypothetical protein HETIRDRAFT_48430 [Heterobasidion irregulare TC 32-1]
MQGEFSKDFTRLLVANGVAWYVTENPETKAFVNKWCPKIVHIPHRQLLAGPLLDKAVEMAVGKVQARVKGGLAMGECDGWTHGSKTPIETSMMTVANEHYLVCTHDLSGQPKTGDNLYAIIKSDKQYIEDTYLVEIIAWITDDGPDGKKAHRLLHQDHPWIIVSVCWAHQINLIVGDYLKQNPMLKLYVNQAIKVIKWFRDHDLPCQWLNQEQLLDHPHALALVLPVITCWMYHYLSISRLLTVSGPLRALVEEVMGIVEDPEFWDQICWYRVYGREANLDFWKACTEYHHCQGRFSDENMALSFVQQACKKEGKELDVVRVWHALEDEKAGPDFNGHQGLIKLAIRLLSIIVNSAGSERSFTKFGNIHTKLHNRQSTSSMHKITTVHIDIERDHANSKHQRLKRKFSDVDGKESTDPTTTPKSSFSILNEMLPLSANLPLEPEEGAEDIGPIKLCDLFAYPVLTTDSGEHSNSSLGFFWKSGVRNVELEMDLHAKLCGED